MARQQRSSGSLTLTAGAGEPIAIDHEVAERQKGKRTVDALEAIIDEQIRDPELRAMIRDPRLALEVYAPDEQTGEHEETPLGPGELWDRVLQRVEQSDSEVEVGIARAHAGGGGGRPARGAVVRFPRQEVVRHPAGYELSPRDRAEVASGRAVFFEGRVIAMVEHICAALGHNEGLWYFLSSREDRDVVRDLIIPEQSASPGYCRARGDGVLGASREARRRGGAIVGAGHSHGSAAVYSSGTDREQMEEMARERVGRTGTVGRAVAGRVEDGRAADGDRHWVEVSFPDAAAFVRLTVPGDATLDPADLAIELQLDRERRLAWFSTHNRHGDHMVPMLSVTYCPTCGSKQTDHIEPGQVTVHVVGPIKITKSRRDRLNEKIWKKVGRCAWSDHRDDADAAGAPETDGCAVTAPALPPGDAAEDPAADTGAAGGFRVTRRGYFVATIPAAVLERAATETPALANALGWAPVSGPRGEPSNV